MRWYNHILIAAAPAAVVAPPTGAAGHLGRDSPGLDRMDMQGTRQTPQPHRGPTHWVAACIIGIVASWLLPAPASGLLRAFAWGGLSHTLADALTVSGVPFSPLSERRFHLMGGRLRTGGADEYGVSWGIVLICWLLSAQIAAPGGGYLPFFPNWAERYEAGTATAKEWRDNRFRFF